MAAAGQGIRSAVRGITLAEGLTLALLPASAALFMAMGIPYGYLFIEAGGGVLRLALFFLPVIFLKLTFDYTSVPEKHRRLSYLLYFTVILGLFLFSPLFGYLPRASEVKRLSLLFVYLSLASLAGYGFAATRCYLADREKKGTVGRDHLATAVVLARTTALLILCYVVHSNLKAAIPLMRVYAWDQAALDLDTLFFFGKEPYLLLHDLFPPRKYTLFFEQFYFFFFYFNAFGLSSAFIFGSRRYLFKVTNTVVLAYHAGLVLYWVFPTLGPCFFSETSWIFRRLPEVMSLKPVLYEDFARRIISPASYRPGLFSGIAAFPSLHVSHSLIYLFYLWPRQRVLTMLNILPFLLLCVSTVYLGWHYVIDIPAGMLLGLLTIWIVKRTWKEGEGDRAP